jgi:hypothetical protein
METSRIHGWHNPCGRSGGFTRGEGSFLGSLCLLENACIYRITKPLKKSAFPLHFDAAHINAPQPSPARKWNPKVQAIRYRYFGENTVQMNR